MISFHSPITTSVVNSTREKFIIMVFPILILVFACVTAQTQEPPTFSNPIRQGNPSSESILRVGNYYYTTGEERNDDWGYDMHKEIRVHRSSSLTEWDRWNYVVAYTVDPSDVNASVICYTIEEVNGSVIITFLQTDRRTYDKVMVIKADNPANPWGTWGAATELLPSSGNRYKRHYTVLKHENKLYLIGSESLDHPYQSALYIRPMVSPTEVIDQARLIHFPEEWEAGTAYRPAVIYNNNVSYVVYTTAKYGNGSSLSYISIRDGEDPLVQSNWKVFPGLVFQANPAYNMHFVADATFTVSPDGSETWMFYSAHILDQFPLYWNSQRIDKITWNNVTGEPVFPVPNDLTQPVPSGQNTTHS